MDYLQKLFDLTGKIAVVTGGGGVLCGTMSKALAQAGVKVAVLDIFPKAAQKVVDEIRFNSGEAIAVRCDVLDKASIEQAAETVLEKFGRVDILINGAGGNKKEATTSPDLPLFDLPSDAVQWVFNLNFLGTLIPSQVFGKIMVAQR
ncbi:MAG: SDR family NAD(P)-dependent oxidoreductase, partial [Chloroflexota bacterium]|nr:SDR family NAD(P)-dependent oxidoreductase [Chloroflexota bacterium]